MLLEITQDWILDLPESFIRYDSLCEYKATQKWRLDAGFGRGQLMH